MKTGNVPLVPGVTLAAAVENLTRPLVVGLYASPERIVNRECQHLAAVLKSGLLRAIQPRELPRFVDEKQIASVLEIFSNKLFRCKT